MSERTERIQSIQHILASIFASQRALKLLAPEFNWAGLGNLLGDFGELVAIDHYGLKKAPPVPMATTQSRPTEKGSR